MCSSDLEYVPAYLPFSSGKCRRSAGKLRSDLRSSGYLRQVSTRPGSLNRSPASTVSINALIRSHYNHLFQKSQRLDFCNFAQKNFFIFFIFCETFISHLCYYNRRNPPIHYIVFATPHKKRNTFSLEKGQPPQLTLFCYLNRLILYSGKYSHLKTSYCHLQKRE